MRDTLTRRAAIDRTFGIDPITEPGLYAVYHAAHRPDHEVVMPGDEGIFPVYRVCGRQVEFRLRHPAIDVYLDKDFPRGREAKTSVVLLTRRARRRNVLLT